MDENPKHADPESEPTIDDLDVPSQDAAEIVGGIASNIEKTRDAAAKNIIDKYR